MFDKRYIENFDWWLFFSVLGIMAIGFINLNSASAATGYHFQYKQLQWYTVGLAVMFLVMCFDYHVIPSIAIHIWVGIVILLVLVLFIGKSVGGSQRWLSLGFMRLQPSELAKICIVMVLSSWFYKDEREQYRIRDLGVPILLTLIPAVLIQRQPDLGTSLLLIALFASIVYVAGIRWTSVIIVFSGVMAAMPLVWKYLKPYQRKRIESFLNPESDPYGAGYHVIQSKIAVGSGQFTGMGYMKGSQAQLKFLPEVHTDFAFSVWSEEWGFVGDMVLLSLFAILLVRGIAIAQDSKEPFGTYLAFGITAMIFWQMVVNLGMVMGLLPVVGVPLPLVSYGGSSVLTTMIGIGLLLNVRARRFMFH